MAPVTRAALVHVARARWALVGFPATAAGPAAPLRVGEWVEGSRLQRARWVGPLLASSAREVDEVLSGQAGGRVGYGVRRAAALVQSRLCPEEDLLCALGRAEGGVAVHAPPSLGDCEARAQVQQLAAARLARHRVRLYAAVALAPLTAALTVLPGPNVFLAYNLFRVYRNAAALRGARRLAERPEAVRVVADEALAEGADAADPSLRLLQRAETHAALAPLVDALRRLRR